MAKATQAPKVDHQQTIKDLEWKLQSAEELAKQNDRRRLQEQATAAEELARAKGRAEGMLEVVKVLVNAAGDGPFANKPRGPWAPWLAHLMG